VQQVCDFDSEDGLSVALSYGYDFTKLISVCSKFVILIVRID
jgi:hypothetical protein